MNDKIRNGAFQMKSRRRGERTAARMNLYAHIKGIGHVADLLDFRNAAAGAHIRLDHLDGVLLEVFDVLPSGIDPFAVGDRKSRFIMHPAGKLRGGRTGLFEIENIVLLNQISKLRRRLGIREGVILDDDIHLRAYLLADRSHSLLVHVQIARAEQADPVDIVIVPLIRPESEETDLDGVVSLIHRASCFPCIILRRSLGDDLIRPGELQLRCIGAQLIAALSAQNTSLGLQSAAMMATAVLAVIAALKYALAAYYIIVPAEVASNLSRYDGVRYGFRSEKSVGLDELYANTRDEGFMPENKRRIMIGNFVLSSGFYDAYFLKAAKARTLICQEYEKAFSSCDVLLTPVSPSPAFKLGEKVDDPVAMYLEDLMSVSLNLAGVPGLAVPAGETSTGLPVGLQLVGPRRSDKALIEFAKELEENE